MPARSETLVYHFTHIDNLPALLAEGGLLADADVPPEALAADVGDPGIKAARRRRRVPLDPGGVVADYVPFYFAPRSPMLYRICRDQLAGSADRYHGGEDPLVYLVSSVERITAAGVSWLATDGNAAAAVSHFSADAGQLHTFIDWPLMVERYWRDDNEDPDRMRRRMAELLVHRRFPLAALAGFGVRSQHRERQVRAILNAHGRTGDYLAVRPDWYYRLDGTG